MDQSTDTLAGSAADPAEGWSVRKILIWLVLACLLPGIVGATAMFIYEYRAGREQLEEDTIQTARALAQAVDNQILQVQALAVGLATSDSLAGDDLAGFHQRAQRALQQSRLGTTVALSNREGRQILNTALPFGTPPPEQGMLPEVVQRIFANGQPAVSNIFTSKVLGRPLMAVAVPVVRNDEIVYVLTVSVLPERFNDILHAQGLPEGWVGTILDADVTIVARSREAQRYLGEKPSTPLFERFRNSDEGTVEAVMKDEVAVLSAYTRSSATGWRVAISIPLDDLAAQFARRFAALALGILALFGIGIALARMMGRKVAHSFEALKAPAFALGAGKAVALPALDVKEAAEVASALEKASELLRERTARIEEANQKLREKEAELEEAHSLARFGTWHWDLATGEFTASKSLREIYGRDVPSFEAQRGTLLTVESWDRIVAAAHQVRETGAYTLELQGIHASGSLLWLHAKCAPVHGADGEIIGLHGTALDITERKQAEEQLRASEQKYRTLFTNMTEGFGLGEPIFDQDGQVVDIRFIEVNAAFYEQTGIQPGIEGRPVREFLPRVEPVWIERLGNAARNGKSLRLESYNNDSDRHYDVYIFSPGPGRFAILFRDITEKKRTAIALQQSESSLRELIATLPGMVWTTTADGMVDFISERWTEYTGVPTEEHLGLEFLAQMHPDDREETASRWREAVANGTPLLIETRLRRHDGVYRWFNARGTPIRDSQGNIVRWLGVTTDIDDLKRAQEAVRESEYRLALALKAGGTAVWEMDVASEVLLATDDRLACMMGFGEGELKTAGDWLACIHEEDRAEIRRLADDVIAGRSESYSKEIRFRSKTGDLQWILCQAVASRRDESGRAIRLVGTHTDITERKTADERFRQAALHDPLTGLPNRALVFEYGGRLLASTQRSNGRAALLFVDLDRFKPINDLYGHEIGDRVLREVANRLTACTRREDLVGRLGGDEFVILLHQLDAGRHRVVTVAQHVIESISRPFEVDTLELSLSPSIGISYYPEHSGEVAGLIHTADLAMYQAKQSGRANYQFYSPELEQRADAACSLEARIKQALKSGGFSLCYQPVVDMQSGKLVGVEALVRLDDGDSNPVGPNAFIPVVESAGLISELGEWVTAEACRQHEKWQRAGLDITVAINVSPLQFRQRDFADRLEGIIADLGVNPGCLQLEVSESTVMESLDDAVALLARIKSIGVKIALDDFGTGYSNLSSLSCLPLDKLKVDQSFVQGVEHDKCCRAVTEAIIALGRSLKLDVVGEGIESENTLRYLRQQGCTQAQGFWVSRPLSPNELTQWHQSRQAH